MRTNIQAMMEKFDAKIDKAREELKDAKKASISPPECHTLISLWSADCRLMQSGEERVEDRVNHQEARQAARRARGEGRDQERLARHFEDQLQ